MESVAECENLDVTMLCEMMNGQLISFPYKDELQKELSKSLTTNAMMFGAK